MATSANMDWADTASLIAGTININLNAPDALSLSQT